MDTNSIYTVIITAVTVLGSSSAWHYYEKRAALKQSRQEHANDDCKERIQKLELLLERSTQEKDELRSDILKLTEHVSALRVKVEFLEKENKELTKALHEKNINNRKSS